MKNLLLFILAIAFTFSCKKKEDVKPSDPVILTPNPTPNNPAGKKTYYTYRIEAVSNADVQIRYAVSKVDPTIKNGSNMVYSVTESKIPYPQKTIIIEDTILKRNGLSSTVHNKLVSDPNLINYKIYIDGTLRFEQKANHVVYDISAGTIK